MLNNKQLSVKIDSFLNRKSVQFPELGFRENNSKQIHSFDLRG